MEGKDYYVVAVVGFLVILLLAIGVRNATFNDAVVNCIQANSDWIVADAHAFCNSVIREGRRAVP